MRRIFAIAEFHNQNTLYFLLRPKMYKNELMLINVDKNTQ